jgi:hypothetical protein
MAARRDPLAIIELRQAITLIQAPPERLAAALRAGRALGVAGYFEEAAFGGKTRDSEFARRQRLGSTTRNGSAPRSSRRRGDGACPAPWRHSPPAGARLPASGLVARALGIKDLETTSADRKMSGGVGLRRRVLLIP